MGDQANQQPLIDVLYRDRPRIESLCAQQFGGLTRAVAASLEASATSHGDVAARLPFIGGSVSGHESESKSYTRDIDPHDHLVLDFMRDRGIALHSGELNTLDDSRILLLSGQLHIRDYQAIWKAAPFIVTAVMDSTTQYSRPQSGKKSSAHKKARREFEEMISSLVDLVPTGLEIELRTSADEVLIGSLKPEYLVEAPQDLLRIHGTKMPGEWYTLGVVDPPVPKTEEPRNLLGMETDAGQLRKSVDAFADATRELFSSSEQLFSISPILLYRHIS